MAVEIFGFIVVQTTQAIYQISNLCSFDIRKLILSMEEGDLLNIKGLGTLMIVDFEVEKKSYNGNELRKLYITATPA